MEILSIILGAVLAIVTTIVIEFVRKPKLKIKISEATDREFAPREFAPKIPAQYARFLYLELTNEKLIKGFKWMQRNPALQCHGTITFHHPDGQKIFDRSMEIRWSRAPEPVATQGILVDRMFGNKPILIFDFTKILLEQRKDIYPGESERFDVAARFEDEEECYGWNNETYFSDPIWRNPAYKLDHGHYLIKVEVISSGEKCMGLFRLVNEGTRSDFRIEQAQESDKIIV